MLTRPLCQPRTPVLPTFKNIYLPLFNLQSLLSSFPFFLFFLLKNPGPWTVVFYLLMGQFHMLCCPLYLLLLVSWISKLGLPWLCLSGETLGVMRSFIRGHIMSGCLSLCDICSCGCSVPRLINSLGVQDSDIYCFHCAMTHILLLINFVIPHNL